MVRSKLTKQVLGLYKTLMQAAKDKPGFQDQIRIEFKSNKKITLAESQRIEFLLRRGNRQLEMLKDPRTTGLKKFRPKTE